MNDTRERVRRLQSPGGRRRLATTVAALALCLTAGTAGARASGAVSTEQAVASHQLTRTTPYPQTGT